MKILSIIGTRPQYIKIKPFFDYCESNDINHVLVDTLQHYSYNVSEVFIKEFGLKIDYSIRVQNKEELNFMSESLLKIKKILEIEAPDVVIVYGDTNSTFCAALAAYKLGIPIAHVEAGVRGFYRIPEEVNRMFVDSVSPLKFCSSRRSQDNLEDGIYSGDLEYELLNNLDPGIEYQDFGVMTIHRQSNINKERLASIFKFCEKVKTPIKFFVHHRTKAFLDKEPMDIPNNIQLLESCAYHDMVDNMAKCSFIITDSGSIQKSSPFFGKKALIMREEGFEWKKTETEGFAIKCSFSDEDLEWIKNRDGLSQRQDFYMAEEGTSSCIIKHIKKFLEERNG